MTNKASESARRLAWQVREAARGAGVLGAAGAGLLAAALVFHLSATRPLAIASAALQRDIAVAEARRHSPQDAAALPPVGVEQQLAEFHRFFPKARRAPDDVAKLHELAVSHGLQMEQGSYRMLRDRGGRLWLYEVTLPVKGDYTQLRGFLSQALAELPHVALDSVSFQRQKAADAMLESQIRFTMFFGEAA